MEQRIRKKILLKGVTTTPDDYLCEDGELAGSMGVESLNGGLQGAQGHGPKVVLDMKGRNFRVVFEHKVKPENNWIVWTGSSNRVLLWLKDGADFGGNITPENSLKCGSKSLPKVEAIGNTLIIVCENDEGEFETHYVLWKKKEDGTYGYQYLGKHIPELEMRFGMVISHRMVCDWEDNYYDDHYKDAVPFEVKDLEDFYLSTSHDISEANSTKITEDITAKLNKAMDTMMSNGLFTQPFLVRYALKMYDGTYSMHSVPVYMPITELDNRCASPYCIVAEYDTDKLRYWIDMIVGMLYYRASASSVEALKGWSDIVKEVDIFVSAPIYTYKQTDKMRRIFGDKNNDGPTLSSLMKKQKTCGSFFDMNDFVNKMPEEFASYDILDGDDPFMVYDMDSRLQKTGIEKLRHIFDPYWTLFAELGEGEWDAMYSHFENNKFWYKYDNIGTITVYRKREKNFGIDIGYKRIKEFYDEVRNCSVFYKVASIKIDKLNTKADRMRMVRLEGNDVRSIITGKVADDEYLSHDTLCAKYLYAYNSRINFADVERELYRGFKPSTMVPYITMTEENRATYKMSLDVESDNQASVIQSASEDMASTQIWPYLYYPNTGAKRITIKNYTNTKGKEYQMEAHTGLNGAVNFNGSFSDSSQWPVDENELPAEDNVRIDNSSKLFTSDTGNPWRFLPTNINTIGNGKVMGMTAVTTALSQGQHGSFPMYCFTSEGIYSLSVNNTGGWVTSQTVTRDVIREGTPLLQIDNAIVFVSEQGVMLLQGDKTVLMSKDQSDKQRMKVSDLPGLSGLLTATGGLTDVGQMAADAMDESLLDYLDVDGMKIGLYYDYTNQRVAVGREDKPYCWLYSLNEATWYTEPWKLLNRVNSYPDCYAMYKATDGKYHMVLLNTNERMLDGDNSAATLGLPEGMFLLTRPIKLGEYADALKELENMTGEGRFDKTKMGMAVWGTRDYKQWYLVGSCKGMHLVRKHGSGFRALVVAVVGKLAKGDFLDSLTMQLQARYMQKMHGMGYKG